MQKKLLNIFLSLVLNCTLIFDVSAALNHAEEFYLDNGLQVLVIPNHKAPVIQQVMLYKTGRIDEPEGKGGIAHFLEHLMFRGTYKFSDGEFEKLIEENGGVSNAATSLDFTYYHQLLSIDRLELAMYLEADRMTGLKIDDAAFSKEKEVVFQERQQRINMSPVSKFWEKYNNTQGQGKTLFLESSTPLKIIITALIISFVWFVIFEFKPIENTSSKTQQTTANHVTNTSGTSAEATNGKKTESKFKVNINDNEVKSENKLNDVNREPDFGPYMRELQRRIRMNWNPPKVSESKRVVVIFKVAKDGRLLSCSVYKSSGLPSADQAALDAIKATAPFKPLPVEYKNPSMDIQFTFDYNIPGAARY